MATLRGAGPLTLEAGVAQRLPAKALVVLDSVHDDGPAEDVGQHEDVGLLQASSGLQEAHTHTHTHTQYSSQYSEGHGCVCVCQRGWLRWTAADMLIYPSYS